MPRLFPSLLLRKPAHRFCFIESSKHSNSYSVPCLVGPTPSSPTLVAVNPLSAHTVMTSKPSVVPYCIGCRSHAALCSCKNKQHPGRDIAFSCKRKPAGETLNDEEKLQHWVTLVSLQPVARQVSSCCKAQGTSPGPGVSRLGSPARP